LIKPFGSSEVEFVGTIDIVNFDGLFGIRCKGHNVFSPRVAFLGEKRDGGQAHRLIRASTLVNV
jgi:hypothetical protein